MAISNNTAKHTVDVAIIGAGLVGRLLAWQLASKHLNIALYEAGGEAGEGAASYVAAAMLAPFGEAIMAEPQIIEMGRASIALWPHIIQQLTQPVFFQQTGSLVVWHPQDVAESRMFQTRLQHRLLPDDFKTHVQVQDKAELEALEPALTPHFKQALYLSGEGQLDNRQLLSALCHDLQACPNVHLFWQQPCEPEALQKHAQLVIDCRGFGAKKRWNHGQWLNQRPRASQLRGIRGEVLRLLAPEVALKRPVRLLHPRYPIYCVPKEQGLFVVGATEIESEDVSAVSVRSALELLSAVHSLHPAFAEARIVEMGSHCRPTLSHHLPEIRYGQDNIIDVNGLYRHGFLVAPVVVDAVVRLILACLQQHLSDDWPMTQPRSYLFTWMEKPHEYLS